MSFKNKKAAAFGSYGWSGESVKMITEKLKEGGFEIVNDGIKELWNPDKQGRENCINFGKIICLVDTVTSLQNLGRNHMARFRAFIRIILREEGSMEAI